MHLFRKKDASSDVTDGGERVTHLTPNTSYYAHLSIYHFALPFCQDAVVLDAGSGAGYGTAYLAAHGARYVDGIDASAKAVAFSQENFRQENLRYQVMGLEEIAGFEAQSFDLIFTSNTLEHIADVPAFMRSAWTLLKPDGVLVVAVPPVYQAESRAANIANPYHLNIWSPRQWHAVLSQYFASVDCVRHHFDKPGYVLDFSDTPATCRLREDDFLFLPSSVEVLCTIGAITAMFVARKPRPAGELPPPGSGVQYVDDSFSRAPVVQRPSGFAKLRAWLRV